VGDCRGVPQLRERALGREPDETTLSRWCMTLILSLAEMHTRKVGRGSPPAPVRRILAVNVASGPGDHLAWGESH